MSLKPFSYYSITMSGTYADNKIHIYNWIEKNPDKYKENNRIQASKRYYRRKAWNDITKSFRHILID